MARKARRKRTRSSRVRRFGRRVKRRLNPLLKMITPATFAGTTVYQMTHADIKTAQDQGVWPNLDITGKLKYVAHNVVRRMTGYGLFEADFGPIPNPGQPVINPAGVLNKFTFAGAALQLLRYIPGFPYKSYMSRIGKGAFWGGIVGGFFDPPRNPIPAQTRTSVPERVAIQSYRW